MIRRRELRLADFSHRLSGELIRLNAVGQMDHTNRNIRPELGGNPGSGAPSSAITIQHEDNAPEIAKERALLWLVQRCTHQGYYRRYAGLVQLQAVEKTFHDENGWLTGCGGAMEVKDNLRLGNPEGKR